MLPASELGRHAWNDGDGNSKASAILDKFHKAVHIIEELRDDHLSTSLNLQHAILVMPWMLQITAETVLLLPSHKLLPLPQPC